MRATVQIFHSGSWHDAAHVTFEEPDRGHDGASVFSYDLGYFYEHGSIAMFEDRPIIDSRAASVTKPIDLKDWRLTQWPSFLLDLMPQGEARRRIGEAIGIDPDQTRSDLPLLLRSASAPIGNIRIKEAYEAERKRIETLTPIGLSMSEITARSDRFIEVSTLHATVASGSSGHQGEWPKIAMTLKPNGRWYPDTMVEDDEACDHVLVKLNRGNRNDNLILEGEAAYLRIAAMFELRVSRPDDYIFNRDTGVFVMPRFDRSSKNGQVLRYGQESIVSALDVSKFGFTAAHESYIELIARVSSDPVADLIEYVVRDALNLATGNPDNHGRNTALLKNDAGEIRLSPLFDFAPMRLAENSRGRPTTWACMRADFSDHDPDWRRVAEALSGVIAPDMLTKALSERLRLFERLPDLARQCGVPDAVIESAIVGQFERIARGIARL